jgi:5-methylcytosine-specific restriction protein A
MSRSWAGGSSPAWRALRLTVLDRDRWQCQIRRAGCTQSATEVDHIEPIAEGGARWDPANLRASCKTCNAGRGSETKARLGGARFGYRTTAPAIETRL